MNDERRYSEQEIAAIFKQAAETQEAAQRQLPAREGLTLAELQAIGQEAGITPAFIAKAAATVGQPRPSAATYLGLPVGVARTVVLPGAFTEADWDRLVVDLRDTFQATGEIRRDGAFREWRNGNLRALIEPTETGHRLSLRTRKGSASSSVIGSLAGLAMGLVLLLIGLISGKLLLELETTIFAALFVLGGLAGLGLTAAQLGRWQDERSRQMDALAARAAERATAPPNAVLNEPDAVAPLDIDARREAPQATPERRAGPLRS